MIYSTSHFTNPKYRGAVSAPKRVGRYPMGGRHLHAAHARQDDKQMIVEGYEARDTGVPVVDDEELRLPTVMTPPPSICGVTFRLASPDEVHSWARIRFRGSRVELGSVTSTETLHYKTLKPVMGGLFCERIFGPVRSYECSCGKIKQLEAPPSELWCDECMVQITSSTSRRYRFGDIPLATPIMHSWYQRGYQRTNPVWRMLFIKKKYITDLINGDIMLVAQDEITTPVTPRGIPYPFKDWIIFAELFLPTSGSRRWRDKRAPWSKAGVRFDKFDILSNCMANGLSRVINEIDMKTFAQFAFRRMLKNTIKLSETRKIRREVHKGNPWGRRKRLIIKAKDAARIARKGNERRKMFNVTFQFAVNCLIGNMHPGWMFVRNVPVIPPDLRPILKLGDGNLASSDLNDLYRTVIFRNARLRKLVEAPVPMSLVMQDMRLVQAAVGNVFDNRRSRRPQTRTIMYEVFEPLRSLADRIVGKAGRFRQNLLGKRVDFSGRSVIIVGPTLRLWECGLPYEMAAELFEPLFMRQLIRLGVTSSLVLSEMYRAAYPITSAQILRRLVASHPVLLNRAPTLHRMGIQAFLPKLIPGRAIQLHPFVCPAFNADFDGDQMAVHVPLRPEAIAEARLLVMAPNNWLSPATGDPSLIPSQDIVLGTYYLTLSNHSPGSREWSYRRVHSPLWLSAASPRRWPVAADTSTAHSSPFQTHFVRYERPFKCIVTAPGHAYILYPTAIQLEDQFAYTTQHYMLTTVGRALLHTYLPDM